MKPTKSSDVTWPKIIDQEITDQKVEEQAYGVDDSEGLAFAEALERRQKEDHRKRTATRSRISKKTIKGKNSMAKKAPHSQNSPSITREDLIGLLNEDLAREYQAIIAYVVYSQVIRGAQYMNIADELAVHATEELAHALTIAKQIDYLGGMPSVAPKPVKTSNKADQMLRFDLDNENETIRNYRQRVSQCESLGEYAIAEHIREILVQEQDHQIELATALGIEIPNVADLDAR